MTLKNLGKKMSDGKNFYPIKNPLDHIVNFGPTIEEHSNEEIQKRLQQLVVAIEEITRRIERLNKPHNNL